MNSYNPEKKANRIQFFDTTKGILMLLLIYGHLIIFARALKVENPTSHFIQITVPFYRVFFMQTFFFITGYCTSWNIKPSVFLEKNLKTIIWPAFIFLPFDYLAKVIIGTDLTISSLANLVIQYIINGLPWFLSSLFLSKILFYIIFKIWNNKVWVLVSCFILLIIVVYIIDGYAPRNIWSYQQAFAMIPFMGLGYCVRIWDNNASKKRKILNYRNLSILSIPYFFIIALWQFLGLGLGFPAVDYYIDIVPLTVPFYIAFAVSGSALILIIAKLLEKFTLLNLLGRQSLFIYLAHALIVCMTISIIKTHWPTFLNSIWFFPLTYTITILILIFGSKLMENKYFSWMVGKF